MWFVTLHPHPRTRTHPLTLPRVGMGMSIRIPADPCCRMNRSSWRWQEDLAELVVKNEADIVNLIEQGTKVRRVAATQMNERSSRSHSCFVIKICHKRVEIDGDIERETQLSAKLNLVDLAGSERASKTGATGDRCACG
jgi:hypothetical protein